MHYGLSEIQLFQTLGIKLREKEAGGVVENKCIRSDSFANGFSPIFSDSCRNNINLPFHA